MLHLSRKTVFEEFGRLKSSIIPSRSSPPVWH